MTLLFVLLGLTQLGDWYSTRTVLRNNGYEINPILRKLFGVLPVDLVLAVKGLIVLFTVYYVHNIILSIFAVVLYTLVVIHNWKQL